MKKTRVGVLNNNIYQPMIKNIDLLASEYDFEVFKLNEAQLTKFILENRFELMLVNPYILARVFKFADFRIVPTRILAAVSYTDQASINFSGNLTRISELLVPSSVDYFTKIAQILLSERYNIFPEIKVYNTISEIGENTCSLIYNDEENQGQLDISEDFFESFEIPLVNGLWIVRNEEEPHHVKDIIEKSYDSEITNEYSIQEMHHNEVIREGSIITRWDDDVKSALEQIYHLLFFRQFIDELPEIKILW